ncbi:AMP-binding protein [Polymorphospora rubra]|uniref:Cyclohexanecarboxylate-CoA ligase n=1 Tax=Polymorphospora rubra TaxID=338584 RepID=A0A810N8R1_9ACTN|nr:AMP-binding protein [Polymorphospora rubra]BCJ67993.1 cyclohexanecarboxylate-CoA ligase [Polymorphospora rubra]
MSLQDLPAAGEHPGVRPDSRLTPELATAYESGGQWTPQTLTSLLADAAAAHPDLAAAVDAAGPGGSRRAMTYAELDAYVTDLAKGLRARGVAEGDSVVVMLPNCIEFAALIFAINRAGAVYTGIPVAYGTKEVGHILASTGAKVVVTQEQVASATPLAVVRASCGEAAPLIAVRGDSGRGEGEITLEDLAEPSAAEVRLPAVDPRAVCHIGFTSGTTGAPKGVMNTNQTLIAVLRNWLAYFGAENLGASVVNAVVSPVGHHSGFLWGVLMTAYLGGTAAYLEKWSPAAAATFLRTERATVFFGAPTFLQDLLTTDLVGDPRCTLRAVITTGSPVPRALPSAGRSAFGCWVGSAWGMTEIGIGVSCRPGMSESELASDGRAVPGVEVRVVAADGEPADANTPGRMQIRSAGLFLGYEGLPDRTHEEIDAEGWFDTGDTARIDENQLVHLEGRSKDIIIRGGENIPVVAVESVLYTHPDVIDVAVVGVPDERLGERACAVVHSRTDGLSLADLVQHLLDNGVSRHFLPERLVLVSSLPKTPSGKIRKAELRERLTSVTTAAL